MESKIQDKLILELIKYYQRTIKELENSIKELEKTRK
jgi:hypothetical protein